MKPEFSKLITEKSSNMTLPKKIRPVGDKLLYEDGRTDRHDEADSRFSQFFEGA